MLEKISNVQPCVHESEAELPHFVNCNHPDVLGYDKDGISNHVEELVEKHEQKEKLLTKYEIGTRRENPEELAKFKELINPPSKPINYFKNYVDIDYPDVYSIRSRLKKMLKDKYESYEKILRSWFSFEIDHEQYHRSINLLLVDIPLKKIHNDYMNSIYQQANSCDINIIDEFSHFFDDLIDGSDLENIYSSDRNSFSDIIISNCVGIDAVHEQTKSSESIETNEQKLPTTSINDEDDDLLIVKKRKRKRCLKIFDDDDNINNENETDNNAIYQDDHLSDGDLVTTTKKKKKRKAMVIESSDEEDDDKNTIFYDAESSNSNDLQQTIDAKSSGPLKTTITIMNRDNNNQSQRQNSCNNNQQKNFSLLSRILNSETTIPHLQHHSSSSSSIYRKINSNTNEPVTYCFNESSQNQSSTTTSSSSSSFPSSFIMANSKIAELLNYKMPDYQQNDENNSNYSSPLLPTSPNISTTLDSLPNSDDASQKSDNYYEWNDNQSTWKSNHSKLESLNQIQNVNKTTIHSFEVFDPIMDATLDDQQQQQHLIKNYDSNDDDDDNNVHSVNDDDNVNTFDQLVKGMSSEEKMDKLKTCYHEVALPDNVRLGLRISQFASLQGFNVIDRKVTQLCNVALKNFIRNILTKLISSRNSFSLRNNRIIYNVGREPINPYLRNSYKIAQKEPLTDLNILSSYNKQDFIDYHESFDRRIEENDVSCFNYMNRSMEMVLDSKLKLKRLGLNRNELSFNHKDQIKLLSSNDDEKLPIRCISRSLYQPDLINHYRDNNNNNNNSCNLHHLYDLLNSNRSLIPVTPVWSRTLYRTVAAFNNLIDSTNR
ncbi:uncharacterized protein LOC142645061 [Dermatophagoides pteronyssinus]|uniref:uncharacterized protein LOC142645061 n=1 Tax=Dermatophagoides pteronyssinus TaxID=6956 RepID=UPI003F6729ED